MSPSHRANRYGTRVEEQVAEEYGLTLARSSWKDATLARDPVEIKSTRPEHSDGQPGNFKLYERYHRKLRREDGRYLFAVYKPWGTGARIVRSTLVHSSKIPRLSWHGGGEHRNSRQAKLGIEEIFG